MSADKTLQRPISITQAIGSTEETANKVIFTVVSDVPESGTDDFLFVHQVKRSGVEIPGFKGSYDTTSGTVTVEDAGASDLTSGDVVTVIGTFYR
jgi:hypothetical protein